MRRTVPPSAEIEDQIDQLLAGDLACAVDAMWRAV